MILQNSGFVFADSFRNALTFFHIIGNAAKRKILMARCQRIAIKQKLVFRTITQFAAHAGVLPASHC